MKKDELLKWLNEEVDRYSFLRVSHPHLAYMPTDRDKESYREIVEIIKGKPRVSRWQIEKWALRMPVKDHGSIQRYIKQIFIEARVEVKNG